MTVPVTGGAAPLRGWADHPALARARDLAARIGPSTAVPFVLYGVYTALLFVIFLAATFPHELVLRRVLEPAATAPVGIEIRGVRLGWTLAYTIDELRLFRRGADPALPLLTATHVRAAPSLLGLLRGRPFPLSIRADVYGGTLDATADLTRDAFAVRAALGKVDVSRYAGLRLFMEGTLQGRVDGTIELAGAALKPTTTAGAIDLRVADLALEGGKVQGFTVPDLHFPEVRLAGAIKAGRLEIDELAARGRELNVQGSGNLLLSHPLAATLLNLDLVASPAAEIPDNLRTALSFMPGEATATGDRHLRLSGTIAQPHLK